MRNVFWGFFLFCMTIITGCHSSELNPEKTIRFAVFADVQYCSIHEKLNGRHYMLAKEQLAEAIRQINEKKPDFVLNLGDLIDHKWENYPVILAELDNLQAPWIGITIFIVLSTLLTLLIFIGEGVRDAFDARKNK